MDGEIYYTRGIDAFESKQKYLKQCFGNDKERYLSYYMPLCAFHENWIHLNSESFRRPADDKGFYESMGYIYTDSAVTVKLSDPILFEQKKISEEAYASLDEVVSVCKENDIAIVFYTAPYQGHYAYGDAMEEYAKKNDCVYFNLFEYIDELGIDSNTDFADENHLNNNGAVKVADFLGEYIVSHYDVTDMRVVDDNIWEKEY